MVQLRMERDRSYPEGGVSATGILWDQATVENLEVPDRIAAGGDLVVSGVLSFDFPPHTIPLFPRPARVEVSAGGDSQTVDVGEIGRTGQSRFSVSLSPNASPGDNLTVRVAAQVDRVIRGWKTFEEVTRTVGVQTETQETVDTVFENIPWMLAGSAVGGAYSRSRHGFVRRQELAIGAVGGLGGREYARRVGIDLPTPNVSTQQIAAIGGVLIGGAFLLQQGGRYVPGV